LGFPCSFFMVIPLHIASQGLPAGIQTLAHIDWSYRPPFESWVEAFMTPKLFHSALL
jgi:hypothetical protein